MKRFYFALTNRCNRSCELCSCWSDPERNTDLPMEKFCELLSGDYDFELQMEGGEPLMHPDFEMMIQWARETGRCSLITVGTNGVLLPMDEEVLKDRIGAWGTPLVIKPSINEHLLRTDSLHIEKMKRIRNAVDSLAGVEVLFNIRRRKRPLSVDDDQWVVDLVEGAGLMDVSNLFFYQRYGKAECREELDLPFVIEHPVDFYLIDPQGRNWGMDLVGRSNAMQEMM